MFRSVAIASTAIVLLLAFNAPASALEPQARMSSQIFEPSAIECPYCGDWRVTQSSYGLLVGATIHIARDEIFLPACGMFRITNQTPDYISNNNSYSKTYLSLLRHSAGPLCKEVKAENLTLTIDFNSHFGKNNSASFEIESNGKEILRFSGWNYERGSPCEAGSTLGSAVCIGLEVEQKKQILLNLLSTDNLGRSLRSASAQDLIGKIVKSCDLPMDMHAINHRAEALEEASCESRLLDKEINRRLAHLKHGT